MTNAETMERSALKLNGEEFFLAQEQDLDDLQMRIEDAIAGAGRFVEFVVVGNRRVRALITPRSRVTITVSTVQFDHRDTGDLEFPYGGHFDML